MFLNGLSSIVIAKSFQNNNILSISRLILIVITDLITKCRVENMILLFWEQQDLLDNLLLKRLVFYLNLICPLLITPS